MRILQVITPHAEPSHEVLVEQPSLPTPDIQGELQKAIEPLRDGLEALQERVNRLPTEISTPPAAAPVEPDPRIADLQRHLTQLQQQLEVLEQNWQSRWKQVDQAVEELRAAAVQPESSPPSAAVGGPSTLEMSMDPPSATTPMADARQSSSGWASVATGEDVQESAPDAPDIPNAPDLSSFPMPEVSRPSLLKRFWNYLNDPAFNNKPK